MPKRGEKKRAEPTPPRVRGADISLLQELFEKRLGQILGIVLGVPQSPSKHEERPPIGPAELLQGNSARSQIPLRCCQNHAPMSAGEPTRACGGCEFLV